MGGSSSKGKQEEVKVKAPETKDPTQKNAAQVGQNDKLTKDDAAAPKPVRVEDRLQPVKKVEKEYYHDDERKLPIDKSSRFRDKTYYGEKFPKPYGVAGPLKFERFTDIFCLLLFALYVLALIIVGVLAASNGKIDSLTQPLDSEGKRCGLDSQYERFPKLLIFKFDSPYRSVCVDECPNFDYNQMKYNSTGRSTENYIQPVYFDNLTTTIETCNFFSFLIFLIILRNMEFFLTFFR